MPTIPLSFAASVIAIVFGLALYRRVLAAPAKNKRANEIADAIRTGAQAFLRRQYGTVAIVGLPIFFVIGLALNWWTAVGFALLHDQRYQGLGFGVRAMQLVIDHVRTQPAARELFLHHVPAEGSAEGFYKRLGFEHTGVEAHGELEMRLAL